MRPAAEQRAAPNVTTQILWLIAVMAPVAMLTSSATPWTWGLPLTYVALAFVVQVVARSNRPDIDRVVQILVLSGSAPFAVRLYIGDDLTMAVTLHSAAVLAIAIGLGYLLAHRVRPVERKGSVI